jgi:quercetin dioxygenase-like cupin family protein
MSSLKTRRLVIAVSVLCAAVLTAYFVRGSRAEGAAQAQAKERARVVLSQPLGKLDGDHLKVTLVEVNYGPGEASPSHSHPCPVVGYVAEGTIRSQVKGQPAKIYKAGESFYEEANGIHAVSANASATEPAKLLAYFVCDHDAPLSVNTTGSN